MFESRSGVIGQASYTWTSTADAICANAGVTAGGARVLLRDSGTWNASVGG